jgi:hypothetical protein
MKKKLEYIFWEYDIYQKLAWSIIFIIILIYVYSNRDQIIHLALVGYKSVKILLPVLTILVSYYIIYNLPYDYIMLFISGNVWVPFFSLYFYSIRNSIQSNIIAEVVWFFSQSRPSRSSHPSVKSSRGNTTYIRYVFIYLSLFIVLILVYVKIPNLKPIAISFLDSPLIADISTIATIQITVVGFGLLIVTFAFNYSNETRGDFRYFIFWNTFFMQILIVSTLILLLLYLSTLFIEYSGMGGKILIEFIVVSFLITTLTIFVLLVNTIKMVNKDPIALYQSTARTTIRRISVIDSRRHAAKKALKNISNTDTSLDDSKNLITIKLNANQLGCNTGDYISDVNYRKLKHAQQHFDHFVNIDFCRNIGDRVGAPEEVVMSIKTDYACNMHKINKYLGDCLKTEEYDPHFGFDPFTRDHYPVSNFIEVIEDSSKKSIENNNTSELNRILYTYHSMFYEIRSKASESEVTNRRVVTPILNSLFRIFIFSSNTMDDRELKYLQSFEQRYQSPAEVVVERTYAVGLDIKQKEIENVSIKLILKLLKEYGEVADTQSPVLAENIRSKIRKLRDYEQE